MMPIRRFWKTSSGGSSTAMAAKVPVGPATVSVFVVLADSSTTNPRVQYAVEEVHPEVDEHVHDRDDGDVVTATLFLLPYG